MKYVVYYRVSTKGQGESGLGLDAQNRDIELFLQSYSTTPFEVIAEITDVRSGKGSIEERPELKKAVEIAKNNDATLLVAKLDRLSLQVSLVASLTDDSKLKLKVAQMPNADNFQLHIYAALAQQERDFISKRTKAALQAAKQRGIKLGGVRPNHDRSISASKASAQARAEKLRLHFEEMIQLGYSTQQMADSLNQKNITTSRGSVFRQTTVQRMLKTLDLR
ncbi:site-specific recombinase resolvase family [Vibrio astriarenae]|nr:site-specific recombinase resolvase family [Vibrio sp. C7]